MKTKKQDIKNYEKYIELKENVVFVNALAERLREKYPDKKFSVINSEIIGKRKYSSSLAQISGIEEIVNKGFLGWKRKTKPIVECWKGKLPTIYQFSALQPKPETNCKSGAILYDTDYKFFIEDEIQKLNKESQSPKEIFYKQEKGHSLLF